MTRELAVLVTFAACAGAARAPDPAPVAPRVEPTPAAPAARAAPTSPTAAPAPPAPPAAPAAPAPAPPPPLAPWRASLAESEHLEALSHPAFDVPGGFHKIRAALARVQAELADHIAALPDDAPDLPEAACKLAREYEQDRSKVEAQLRRGIAVARARGNGQAAQLYGSLHRTQLNIDPGARWRDGKLALEATDGLMGGFVLWDCSRPDVGTLRLRLADLYATEARYPSNPFTKEAHPGKPTSKRSRPGSALAELDALYREISAARDDAAAATIQELAAIVYCEPKRRASVCVDRMTSSRRAVAIRERLLRADDPVLADTLVLHARLIAARHGRRAEADYRRVLAQAAPGAEARLHAATDLNALLRARRDHAAAQALEASFIADLERPAGIEAWTWATLAATWADVAIADGRPEAAARILAAAARGILEPFPSCPFPGGCDNRAHVTELLRRQAALEPSAAPALLRQVADIERALQAARAQHAAEVARMMRAVP